MQPAARLTVIVFAILLVIVVLALWKRSDRREAIAELEGRFGAQLSISPEEFYLGCSSPELKDLSELAELVLRVGNPQILDLTGAPALVSLKGADRLPSLTSIVAIDCPALASAEGVSGLPRLTQLHFTDSAGLADTRAIQGLPQLKSLDLSGCVALASLELKELPSLENLYLSRCRSLKTLDVSAFPGLKQLYVDGCADLGAIAGLESLKSLTDLDASNATSLVGLPGIGSLSELVVLDIRNLDLTDFSGIASLPKLRVLRMGGQDTIETLEPFTSLASLRELHLEACPNLRSLRGIPSGVSQYAGFTYCPKLLSLEGIGSAGALEHLDVTGCGNLADVSEAASLAGLVQVSFVKCRAVTAVPFVEKLPKLRIVMLGGSGVVPASVEGIKTANEEIIFDFAVAE
jgi:hypothetical protein